MEDFVRRIFSDSDFRREFLANPTRAIADSGLSGHERDAAERLSGHLSMAVGSQTASQAALNRVESMVWF